MLWTHLLLSLQGSTLRSDLKEIASRYQQWGWEALSLVQRYSTRSFALLASLAKRYQLKPIYALEILTHAPGIKKAYPAILIALNQDGIQHLYDIVTYVNKNQKFHIPAELLEPYQKDVLLLIGEELEQEEKLAERSLTYYQERWLDHFWVLCSYTETKPIEPLRRLVTLVGRYSLQAVAAVPQDHPHSLLSYEEVQAIFHNHPDFLEGVTRLLNKIPFLPPCEISASSLCSDTQPEISLVTHTTLSLLSRVVQYHCVFLIHTVPVNLSAWFHEHKKRGELFQSILFQVKQKQLVLFLPSTILKHLLRWLYHNYQGHVGYLSAKEKKYTLFISGQKIEKLGALGGEIEGIPIIHTTFEILLYDNGLVCRLESHWIWDVLHNLHQQNLSLIQKFPLALHRTDHPLLTDMNFFYERRHVISQQAELFREISRAFHPFLQGPFVYREEALAYLLRFVPKEEAKEFLLLLQRDDPRWLNKKHSIEEHLPPEERHSLYWTRLVKEGRYLPSKRQEKLRWYGLSLFLGIFHQHPIASTAAILNAFHHPRHKNRIILYARLVFGIEFLPPSARLSQIEDTVENGKIRLGLRHVPFLSPSMKELIVAKQPYEDFFDFLHKHPSLHTHAIVEGIYAGLFDDLEPENSYKLLLLHERKKEDHAMLFDEKSLWEQNLPHPSPFPKKNFTEVYKLYIQEHPLDPYQIPLSTFHRNRLRECEHLRYGIYVATPVGIHHFRHTGVYEIVDETAWKRVFFQKSPPFSLELYKPYLWKIVFHAGKLEVIEVFPFGKEI
ncbi:MAG: hypothetical protein N2314_01235 [Brevinematales bacterium]|nr:hypothetical protein [Brevinematales bacterium]